MIHVIQNPTNTAQTVLGSNHHTCTMLPLISASSPSVTMTHITQLRGCHLFVPCALIFCLVSLCWLSTRVLSDGLLFELSLIAAWILCSRCRPLHTNDTSSTPGAHIISVDLSACLYACACLVSVYISVSCRVLPSSI